MTEAVEKKEQEQLARAEFIGQIEMPDGKNITCCVLDDEKHTRVVSKKKLEVGIGLTHGGGLVIAAKNLNVTDPLAHLANPIRFRMPNKTGGSVAFGYTDKQVTRFVGEFIKAKRHGLLPDGLIAIEERCWLLFETYAEMGLKSLIDERTGYQKVRNANELQKYWLGKLAPHYSKWAARFPSVFYELVCKLCGYEYNPKTHGPRAVADRTNEALYHRFPSILVEELRRKNPPDAKGRRPQKNHQWFNEDLGIPELEFRIKQCIDLMQLARSWEHFLNLLDKVSPASGTQISLGIDEAFDFAAE